jgi:opacity protein-like surface antigen
MATINRNVVSIPVIIMKKCFSFALALCLAGLGFGTTVVHGQDYHYNPGFYLNGDVGVNFASRLGSGVPDDSTELNPGVRGDLAIGYAIGLGHHFALAPEFEAGAIYNSFGNGFYGGQSTSGGGDLVQVPLLINLVLSYQINPRWSVYGGFGVGVEYSEASVNNSNGSLAFTDDQGGLAVQVKAGIQYRLGPGELGLSYEYLNYAAIFYNNVNNNNIAASYTIHF